MNPAFRTFAIICLLVCPRHLAWAMEGGDMLGREVLQGHANKIAVLEYANPGEAKWGREFSEVLGREILGSLRGVGSAGVATLRQTPDMPVSLSLENVMSIAWRQKAKVVIWGEFYPAGDKVYLHSHLRLMPYRGAKAEPLQMAVPTAEGEIRAEAPSLLVNFEPIEFTTASLSAIRISYEKSGKIRAEPKETAEIRGELSPHYAYGVTAVQGQWMQVNTQDGYVGWVQFAVMDNQAELAGIRGLVEFACGMLQYQAGNYEAAYATMASYLERAGGQGAANRALAHLIRGYSRFEAQGRRVDESVTREFSRAAELLPNAAAPANYLAAVRLLQYGESREYHKELQEVEARLIQAVQAQNDTLALQNLQVFYRLAAKTGFIRLPSMDRKAYAENVAKQQALIDHIAAQLNVSWSGGVR